MKPALYALLALSACSHPAPVAPTDQALSRFEHAGDIALAQELPAQAAEQYRAALTRARERDDAGAIADAGFNLAAAQLAANDPGTALQTAENLRAELKRRTLTDPALDLITATALFRTNRLAEADRWASTLTTTASLSNPAWFLRGLIADSHHDRATLQHAASALTSQADPGDQTELQARVTRDPTLALAAADIRRTALDYRGMARCLALAAHDTPDPARAADLYLRAGRSAAAQHDAGQARIWLMQARSDAREPVLRRDVERAIDSLKEVQ